MEIQELVWLEANETNLAETHGVSRREVEHLVAHGQWVVLVHPDYPDQVRVVGPTSVGRLITVVLDQTPDPAVWRPVTGWTSTAGEMAYYFREYR